METREKRYHTEALKVVLRVRWPFRPKSIVRFLLGKGADIQSGGWSALCEAARWGNDGIVTLLLKEVGDFRDGEIDAALQVAVSGRFHSTERLLRQHGANRSL